MSVFFQWQIICYLCSFDAGYRSLQRIEMLITIAILTILGLLFGKITIKEIKEYVRKRKYGDRTDNTGRNSSESGN
jgi:hypothetical protein